VTAFDTFADGINHLANSLLELTVPVLIGWVLWLAKAYLPKLPPERKDDE
jgi:hypothetical protein